MVRSSPLLSDCHYQVPALILLSRLPVLFARAVSPRALPLLPGAWIRRIECEYLLMAIRASWSGGSWLKPIRPSALQLHVKLTSYFPIFPALGMRPTCGGKSHFFIFSAFPATLQISLRNGLTPTAAAQGHVSAGPLPTFPVLPRGKTQRALRGEE